jgi:WD40 repeat protein
MRFSNLSPAITRADRLRQWSGCGPASPRPPERAGGVGDLGGLLAGWRSWRAAVSTAGSGYDGGRARLLRAIGTDSCRGVRALAFAPDGKSLAAAGLEMDSTVKIWDPQTGSLLRALVGHEATAPAACTPSVCPRVLARRQTPRHGRARQAGPDLDLETGNRGIGWPDTRTRSGRWPSPDGKTLAGGGADKSVPLWDPATGGFGPLSAGTVSGSMRWPSRRMARRSPAAAATGHGSSRSPARRAIATCDSGMGRRDGSAVCRAGPECCPWLSPRWDETRLRDRGGGPTPRRRDGRTTGRIHPRREVTALAFAPDGRRWSAAATTAVAVVALPKRPWRTGCPAPGSVNAVASADARGSSVEQRHPLCQSGRPATAAGPGGVRLWDAKTGRLVRPSAIRRNRPPRSPSPRTASGWRPGLGTALGLCGSGMLGRARSLATIRPGKAVSRWRSPRWTIPRHRRTDRTVQLRDARTERFDAPWRGTRGR